MFKLRLLFGVLFRENKVAFLQDASIKLPGALGRASPAVVAARRGRGDRRSRTFPSSMSSRWAAGRRGCSAISLFHDDEALKMAAMLMSALFQV